MAGEADGGEETADWVVVVVDVTVEERYWTRGTLSSKLMIGLLLELANHLKTKT